MGVAIEGKVYALRTPRTGADGRPTRMREVLMGTPEERPQRIIERPQFVWWRGCLVTLEALEAIAQLTQDQRALLADMGFWGISLDDQ